MDLYKISYEWNDTIRFEYVYASSFEKALETLKKYSELHYITLRSIECLEDFCNNIFIEDDFDQKKFWNKE